MNLPATPLSLAFLMAGAVVAGHGLWAWQGAEADQAARLAAQTAAERQWRDELRRQAELAADLGTLTRLPAQRPAVDWPALLDNIAGQLEIGDFSAQFDALSDGALPGQRIRLRGRLSHEGEFLRLLEQLMRTSGALIDLTRYRLERSPDGIAFDCVMDWRSVPALAGKS